MTDHQLMIIAVYPGMLEDIQAVCAKLKVKPFILEWEFAQQELIDKLNEIFLNSAKPDVIISRGATAGLIEANFPEIVSIRAEPDNLEIMETLSFAKQYGKRMGLLLYDEFIHNYTVETVRKLLDIDELKIYPFRTGEDIISQVYQCKSDGLNVLVGGGTLAERTGRRCDMKVCSVHSGRLTLEKAVHQAVSIIYARQQEKLQLRCFSAAAASIHEGILSLENGRIIVANKGIEQILGKSEAQLIGNQIQKLPSGNVPNELVQFLLRDTEDETILIINGQSYYVRKSVAAGGKSQHVIVVFQNAEIIQRQEQMVRSELRNSGFVAKYQFDSMVSSSSNMKTLIEKAKAYATTDANILITGNSGTGKELLAQSIHNASPRQHQPFVAVNCAAIPQPLLESELFGYEEGAFSGAKRGGKRGLFELAHQGTIFLDEVNSMPLELQSVLLRTIQEREVRRIGAQKNIFVDIRILAASNINLKKLSSSGGFRADLFYRLNTLQLSLPDLSEREDDIIPLARHFIRRYARKYCIEPPILPASDEAIILARRWEGNIRELESIIHRYVVLNRIMPACSILECIDQDYDDSQEEAGSGNNTLQEAEMTIILERLRKNGGNKAKTAEELGISRSTLWKKLNG